MVADSMHHILAEIMIIIHCTHTFTILLTMLMYYGSLLSNDKILVTQLMWIIAVHNQRLI